MSVPRSTSKASTEVSPGRMVGKVNEMRGGGGGGGGGGANNPWSRSRDRMSGIGKYNAKYNPMIPVAFWGSTLCILSTILLCIYAQQNGTAYSMLSVCAWPSLHVNLISVLLLCSNNAWAWCVLCS